MSAQKLGILLTLAVVPAFAQIPAESAPASTPTITPRQHRPRSMVPHEELFDPIRNLTISYNTIWAGYAVTGSDFTYVQGSWIVSAVNCSKTPNTDSSEWVGIDGWTSNTVEQIGTDADCNGKTPSYYVWYEFYPEATIVIDKVSIAAGNKFSASVTYDGKEYYTVAITNDSTGQSFSKKVKFTGADGSGVPLRNSAEWIMEMDGFRLSDFGVDSFGKDYTELINDEATDSSASGVINDFGSDVQESITTTNGSSSGKVTARPSALASDGASFTVTWKAE